VETAEALVSVIIPVYNGAQFLGEAISSVLAQTYRPFEVIVINDGSTDESARVAKQFPVRYSFQPHSGGGAARNHGIALTHGAFIAFLDADDLWVPEKLAWQYEAFLAQSKLEAVFGQEKRFTSLDGDNTTASVRFESPHVNGWLPSAMLIRRTAFMRVGLYATNWRAAESVEWFVRAQEAMLESLTLPQVVLHRRVHANNLTVRKRETLNREYAEIIKMALDRRRRQAQTA
jgi:glycosyltransferase involved in cell wall biosynthesis